jgi:hypothetical protein
MLFFADLRKNAITDKGLQMICGALAMGKAKALLEVCRLSKLSLSLSLSLSALINAG